MKKIISLIKNTASELRKHISKKTFFYFVLGILTVFLVSFAYAVISTHTNPLPDKQEREATNTSKNIVNDVTELNPIQVLGIIVPHSEEEIVEAVKNNDHVSIGGGRNSMGGQTASERAVQIDMREYNKILSLSTSTKEITVQSGIRWRDIQDYIDPYDLSVKIMQTYSNFTVGGSLSVNVHGRYIGLGPMIMSIKSFRIVLADGSVVTATPEEHKDIFYSAIGGMGGIGVVTDVTLELADNVNVKRVREVVDTSEYANYFMKQIKTDPSTVFHNGDIYPPNFERISAVTWVKTDEKPTTEDRMIPREQDYWKERIAWIVMSEWPFGLWIREHLIDPIVYSGDVPVHTRNYEASYDIAELEPTSRYGETYVLQEYFVPVENFEAFVPKMKQVFSDNDVNVINVSIRHANADPGAKLAWARSESFAFVVYYKQDTDDVAKEHVAKWTREMIDAALSVNGTYYLPYQIQATDDQIHRAYPGLNEYFEIKKTLDPTDKFTNKLWDTYYSEEKLEEYKEKQKLNDIVSKVPDYYRKFDNAYLSIPEWYIVYSADEYAVTLSDGLPSDFSYFNANKDYWSQHETVTNLVKNSPNNNDGYLTVLNVIGWSFSLENFIKGIYENTFGSLSEWVAGNNRVAEDYYAATVAKDYADFIYEYPWYDFPYFSKLIGVWTLKNEVDYTILQDVRRLERKMILSLEYGIKSIYSSIIAFATHSKFGVQDDIIYAIVTKDSGETHNLISAAHYQPFTRLLLEVLNNESNNPNFSIEDISGNNQITLTYKDEVGSDPISNSTLITRDKQTISIISNEPQYLDRITVLVSVSDIPGVYQALKKDGISIDHFYDY